MFRVFPKTGRERWMLDISQRRPWHLKTWPRASLRAKGIYSAAWTLGTLGVQLPCRMQRYDIAPGSLYAQLQDQFEHLGVFLGTPGPNRKFVLYAGQGEESYFIKVPLSPVSAALVAREKAALVGLAADPDLGPLVPHTRTIAGHLALANLESQGARYNSLELDELVRLHDLMYRRSETMRTLSSLRADWQANAPEGEVIEHQREAKRSLKVSNDAANYALDAMRHDLDVPCYMAHGDFTQWNVLRAPDGTARIIDWELFGVKPKWFDLLHYVVSHDLLVSRTPAGSILKRLSELGQTIAPTAEQVWWRQVTLYFSYQCLYYGSVYERQAELHQQAIWQMETWAGILHELRNLQPASAPAEVQII